MKRRFGVARAFDDVAFSARRFAQFQYIEIDAELAARATENLKDLSHVQVHPQSGIADDLPKADAIYVCAGITQPSWTWLDAMRPGVDNLRQAKAREVYILNGNGEEIYEPHFTYHGFRYVEVTGYQVGLRSTTAAGSVSGTYPVESPQTAPDALPEVKGVVDWVAPSNNDHGVHAALARYGLCE